MAIDTIKSVGILDDSIATADIADNAVSTAKVANDAITSAKLDTNIAVAGTLGVTGLTTLSGNANITGDTATLTLTDNSSHSANTGPAISFFSNDSGGASREVAKIVGESHSGANEGNLALQTRNGGTLETKWKLFKNGNFIPTNSAYGIVLGNTTSNDANLLDDYEEGTWSPIITRSSSAPSLTYQRQHGTYVKVGRNVSCHFNVYATSISGGGGNFLIGGLPFTTNSTLNNGSEGYRPTMYFGYFSGASSTTTPRGALVNGNTNHATMYRHVDADARSNYSQVASTLGSTLNFYGSVTYISQS